MTLGKKKQVDLGNSLRRYISSAALCLAKRSESRGEFLEKNAKPSRSLTRNFFELVKPQKKIYRLPVAYFLLTHCKTPKIRIYSICWELPSSLFR